MFEVATVTHLGPGETAFLLVSGAICLTLLGVIWKSIYYAVNPDKRKLKARRRA
jgi:hypothetical protein